MRGGARHAWWVATICCVLFGGTRVAAETLVRYDGGRAEAFVSAITPGLRHAAGFAKVQPLKEGRWLAFAFETRRFVAIPDLSPEADRADVLNVCQLWQVIPAKRGSSEALEALVAINNASWIVASVDANGILFTCAAFPFVDVLDGVPFRAFLRRLGDQNRRLLERYAQGIVD